MRNLQISDLHASHPASQPSAQESPVFESSLLRQLVHGATEKSGRALNPSTAILSISRTTAQVSDDSVDVLPVLWFIKLHKLIAFANVFLCIFCKVVDANDYACKLFECAYSDLIGRKLTSLVRANQMLQEILKEDTVDSTGNLNTVSAKVV